MRSGTRTQINLAAMRRPTNAWELKQREPNGQYQRESVAEICGMPTPDRPASGVVRHRLEMGVPLKDVRDPLAGYAFGRMYMQRVVSETQYNAGKRWEGIVRRYATSAGFKAPMPRSASLGQANGKSCAEDTHEDDIDAAKAFNDCYSELMRTIDGHDMLKAMKAIILMDQRGDVGALRMGLNVLARMWG